MPISFQINKGKWNLRASWAFSEYRNYSLTCELELKQIAIISIQFAHKSSNHIYADKLVKKTHNFYQQSEKHKPLYSLYFNLIPFEAISSWNWPSNLFVCFWLSPFHTSYQHILLPLNAFKEPQYFYCTFDS